MKCDKQRRLRGWTFVFALFSVAGAIAFAKTRPADPQEAIDRLVQVVRDRTGKEIAFRSGTAHVSFLPTFGYHLTIYVGSHARFAPARYLILTRLKGDYHADLMAGQGVDNVDVIRDDALRDYLARADLDLGPFDALFEERFTVWPPPQGH